MANKLPKIFIALWMVLLLSLGLYYVCFAPRDSEFSDVENRTLAAFPEVSAQSLFSGDFGEEIETYLLDRFPARGQIVSAVSQVQNFLSLATHQDYLLIAQGVEDPLDTAEYLDDLDELLSELTTPSTQAATKQTESTAASVETQPTETQDTQPTEPAEYPPIEEKPDASIEDFKFTLGIFMDTGRGPEPTMAFEHKNVAAVTAVLNKVARLLPENGKLMFAVGPGSYIVQRFATSANKVSFYNTWDEVVTALGDDNVYAFDTADIFCEHLKDGAYLSFRTDNHWTPYGAYLVYQQMAARAGKSLCSYYEDFDIVTEEGFRGSYYREDPTAYMNVRPDTLEILTPKIPVEYREITGKDSYKVIDFIKMDAGERDRYTVYLSGPGGPWRYAECDNGQTENCLVITDSFGMTFIPFLTYNYKQIHYYDARYYDKGYVGCSISEMIEKYNIHDVYVIVADFHSFGSGFLLSDTNRDIG